MSLTQVGSICVQVEQEVRSGITIPDYISLRGVSVQTCTLQMLNVTQDTTLVTMGENCRVEDLTLKLTSQEHHTLKGIVFGGTSTKTSKVRTVVLTVDNSSASMSGTSNVTGVECNGTGNLSSSSFTFNSLKGSTLNVYSNGGGNKRGVLVSNSNTLTTRDMNIFVAAPSNTSSTGSYVGVETNDTNETGAIQLRATTVGTVRTTGNYTSSDILQTTPTTIINPTYLASAGIQIGPGTDLVTKTAGGKGFSTFCYPTILFYGLKGSVGNNSGYLWCGTQTGAPDTTSPPSYFRIQQPSIISGLSCVLNTGTGNTNYVKCKIQYTKSGTTTPIYDTSFSLTLSGTLVSDTYYNNSVSLNTGDRLHLYVTSTSNNVASDLTVQIDLF